VVRPGRVAGGDVEEAVLVVEHPLVRYVAGGLAGHALPGGAAVGGAVDGLVLVGHADVDRLGGLAAGGAGGVEDHPDHARLVALVAVGVVRIVGVVAGVGEIRHLRPGLAVVGAPPQPVAVGRAEVEDAVAVGVHGQPLAHAPAGHVAAQLERQLADPPGLTPVGRAQDRAVVGVPVVGVHADGGVHPVGVDGVGGDAVHAVVPPSVPAHPVEQRGPGLVVLVPAVRAADVGARVDQVRLRLAEDDRGDEAASPDTDVLPRVRFGRDGG